MPVLCLFLSHATVPAPPVSPSPSPAFIIHRFCLYSPLFPYRLYRFPNISGVSVASCDWCACDYSFLADVFACERGPKIPWKNKKPVKGYEVSEALQDWHSNLVFASQVFGFPPPSSACDAGLVSSSSCFLFFFPHSGVWSAIAVFN